MKNLNLKIKFCNDCPYLLLYPEEDSLTQIIYYCEHPDILGKEICQDIDSSMIDLEIPKWCPLEGD